MALREIDLSVFIEKPVRHRNPPGIRRKILAIVAAIHNQHDKKTLAVVLEQLDSKRGFSVMLLSEQFRDLWFGSPWYGEVEICHIDFYEGKKSLKIKEHVEGRGVFDCLKRVCETWLKPEERSVLGLSTDEEIGDALVQALSDEEALKKGYNAQDP